ncbi:hypothetical protein TNCV_3460291 [Trichonephila clavipes]|nr:hypothetical protein TNCV_3460291 [Trichonephila clavipes]
MILWLMSQELRVSAADKELQVYPLDPPPNAVTLYSGFSTPGKHRLVFFQMTGTLPPLLDSVVDGGMPGRSCVCAYGSNAAVPK